MTLVPEARFTKARQGENGQSTILLAVSLIMLLAMGGFVIDVGRAFYTYRQLQASTDAAALAGAAELPASDATTIASRYSGVSPGLNYRTTLSGATFVTGYPKVLCLNSLKTQGMACNSPANGNAVQVRETITMPTTFMKLAGKSSLLMTAVATASTGGGASRPPYTVAIIVDSTLSMNYSDSDSLCNDTRLNCALAGIRVLLQNLNPCPTSMTTCGSASNGNIAAANQNDRVALYTFPALASAADAAKDYDCSSSSKPTGSYYTDSGFGGALPTYKVVDYSTDYRTSDSTTTLNTSSNLVKAVGGGASGCTGLQATIGYGTYIAGAMYAAGNDLITLQSRYPDSQSVIVILTDGDMNAPQRFMPNASTTSGTYASTKNECQQAVSLASLATSYKVIVYSVAYGATSTGCSTDVSGSMPDITPCQTVQYLATSPVNFYSDYTASGGSTACVSASNPTTGLNAIFAAIASSLSRGRLISDNTT